MAQTELNEAIAWAGELLNDRDIEECINEKIHRHSKHYLFTTGREGRREGYCTACRSWVSIRKGDLMPEYELNDMYLEMEDKTFKPKLCNWESMARRAGQNSKHGSVNECPNCKSMVQFHGLGRGKKELRERYFLIEYRKVRGERDTIACVGYDVEIEYTCIDRDEHGPRITTKPMELCVFRYGQGGERWVKDWCCINGRYELHWKKRKQCKSGYRLGNAMFGSFVKVIRDEEAYREAVEGTAFERVLKMGIEGCETGCYTDKIGLMDKIARYPMLEYLLKLGLVDIAKSVADGTTERLVNLKGKTLKAVLRLEQAEWAELKGRKIRPNMGYLRMRRWAKANGIRLTAAQTDALNWQEQGMIKSVERLRKKMEAFAQSGGGGIEKYIRYAVKKNVRTRDYIDHIEMMKELQMSMRDEEWMYPKDFYEKHAMLGDRLNARKHAESNALIAERISSGELDEYLFSALGLTMRPMKSAEEIITEGTVQRICVAIYVDTYAKGNDVLCVIRKDEEPNKPLYTVEFDTKGKLVQCRGYRNGKGPLEDEQMEQFWRLFDMTRTAYQKERKRRQSE